MASNLSRRLLFSLVAAPLGWLAINLNLSIIPASWGVIFPGHLCALFLALAATFEYTKLLSALFPKNGFWLSYVWLTAMLVLFMLDRSLPGIFPVYVLLLVVAFEAILFGKGTKHRWNRASLFFSGNVFLYIAGISMLKLYDEPFSTVFVLYNNPLIAHPGIIVVVGAIIMCDTGAFFVGRALGKNRLSSVSPNKTIEGSIGGFLFAFIWSTVGWALFAAPPYKHLIFGVILGIIIGVFAQLGDLLVSLIKRYFRVKDASNILPGHGGFLDRFGSIFFTLPEVWLYFWVLKKFVIGQ